jgi:hypothetical protein
MGDDARQIGAGRSPVLNLPLRRPELAVGTGRFERGAASPRRPTVQATSDSAASPRAGSAVRRSRWTASSPAPARRSRAVPRAVARTQSPRLRRYPRSTEHSPGTSRRSDGVRRKQRDQCDGRNQEDEGHHDSHPEVQPSFNRPRVAISLLDESEQLGVLRIIERHTRHPPTARFVVNRHEDVTVGKQLQVRLRRQVTRVMQRAVPRSLRSVPINRPVWPRPRGRRCSSLASCSLRRGRTPRRAEPGAAARVPFGARGDSAVVPQPRDRSSATACAASKIRGYGPGNP